MAPVHAHGLRVAVLTPLVTSFMSALIHARDSHDPHPTPIPRLASFKSVALVHAHGPHGPRPALIRLALFRLEVVAPRIDPAGLILRDLRELFLWAARLSHDPADGTAALPEPVLSMLADLMAVGAGDTHSPTRVIQVGRSRSRSRSHSPTRIIGAEHNRGRSRSPTRIVQVGSSRSQSHSPPRIIHVHQSSETLSHSPTRIIRVDDDRSHRPRSPRHYPHEIHVVGSGVRGHAPLHALRQGLYTIIIATVVEARPPQVVRVGGTPSQTPTPQVIRVTSPQAQIPNVIRVGGSPQAEEPPRITCVGVPRTTLPPYLPTDADKQPGEPTQNEESVVPGASEIPPDFEIPEPQQQRPPVHRTASGRTEAPPPQVIRIGAGLRAGHSDVLAEQIRVTTPGPIEYPYPPQVIHIGTSPSEDYPPQIVRVGLTKPVPQPEAPPTIVRIPTAQDKPEYQTHVICVVSPAVVAPSVPHVIRLGTPSHAQEEPQWIRIKSPPRQIIDPVPQVVHLKLAPQAPVGPQIIRVATAIPQPDLTPAPAQVFRIGTPTYPEPPQIVHVETAKPTLPDKPEQIIRIGTLSYPEPPQTPQVIHVGVQPPKEVAEPQVVRIGTPGGVPPAPREAPSPVEVVRIGSPTTTAPTEPQVIRATSPPAQPQEPVRVVRVGSAAPRDFDPQVIHVKSPKRSPAPTRLSALEAQHPPVVKVPRLSESACPTHLSCSLIIVIYL
ncbi:hypothetical protein FRC11_008353 [Ceratobasidium sp. 423]|nr:hypothetical protein FRC11_008353 [Ceratobasidium sp. 423]